VIDPSEVSIANYGLNLIAYDYLSTPCRRPYQTITAGTPIHKIISNSLILLNVSNAKRVTGVKANTIAINILLELGRLEYAVFTIR
jgi:hypothetical protein